MATTTMTPSRHSGCIARNKKSCFVPLWLFVCYPSFFLSLFLSFAPYPTMAQQCPLTIWVYYTQSQCDSGQTPVAVGGLYADETCRETLVLSGAGDSNATSLLPGRYTARCVSVNQVQIYQSGCTTSDCSSTVGASVCNRDVTAVASFYSRLNPPQYLVQNPNPQFQTCLVLSGSGKSVTFSIFGNCNDPSCYNTLYTGNSSSMVSTLTRFPTPAPQGGSSPTIPATTAPTTRPPVTTATHFPTRQPHFDAMAPTTRPPTPAPTLRQGSTSFPTGAGRTTTAPTLHTTPLSTSATTTLSPNGGGSKTLAPSITASIPIEPPPSPPSAPSTTKSSPQPSPSEPNPSPVSAVTNPSTANSSTHLGLILGISFGGFVVFIVLLVTGYVLGSKRVQNKFATESHASGPTGTGGGAMGPDGKLVYSGPGGVGPPSGPFMVGGSSNPHPAARTTLPNSEIYCYGEDDISTLGPPMGLSFVDETTAASIVDYDYTKNILLQQQQQRDQGTVADQTTESSQRFSTVVSLQNGDFMLGADEASFEEQFMGEKGNGPEVDDEDEDDENNARRPRVVQFDVTVPPGKLGMVIDDPRGFPQVIAIKPDSVLLSQGVQKGDLLLAVDDLDVSHMSCLETSNLISRKSDRTRKLLFARHLHSPSRGNSKRNLHDIGSSTGGGAVPYDSLGMVHSS